MKERNCLNSFFGYLTTLLRTHRLIGTEYQDELEKAVVACLQVVPQDFPAGTE